MVIRDTPICTGILYNEKCDLSRYNRLWFVTLSFCRMLSPFPAGEGRVRESYDEYVQYAEVFAWGVEGRR